MATLWTCCDAAGQQTIMFFLESCLIEKNESKNGDCDIMRVVVVVVYVVVVIIVVVFHHHHHHHHHHHWGSFCFACFSLSIILLNYCCYHCQLFKL